MATAIHSGESGTPDTGAWVQASSSTNSLVRVVATHDEAEVDILVSETNGPGIGSAPDELVNVRGSSVVYLPSGTYYINADILRNPGTIDITVQN